MYKILCRTYQTVMKVGNYFLPYHTPKCIQGPSCVNKVASYVKKENISNVLIVIGKHISKSGLADNMINELEKENIMYTIFNNIDPNPTSDNVEEGYNIFKENQCQGIIVFGGGGPMDCAKAIAAKVAQPNKSISQLQGILKVHKKVPPLFAVPTTSGTGSETTIAAVITDSKTRHKASINDTALIPEYAFLDPLLTIGLPPNITAITGMDALCHAVEAYTNSRYCTKLENELAKKAVKLIYDNLYIAYVDGNNIKARQNMQKAAFFAGRAFTRGCVGYVHAIGHTLGGLYDVPHGLAMAVILPHVLRQYDYHIYDKLADLADVCGISGVNNQDKAIKFIEWIETVNKKMGLQSSMNMIQDKDIPQIIEWAMKEANPLYPVPVIWNKDDFEKLIDLLR